MTDAEFLALLWQLRQSGMGGIDCAIAACGKKLWCWQITIEKWDELHHLIDVLDEVVQGNLLTLAEFVLRPEECSVEGCVTMVIGKHTKTTSTFLCTEHK